jgi:hypothetical protein
MNRIDGSDRNGNQSNDIDEFAPVATGGLLTVSAISLDSYRNNLTSAAVLSTALSRFL